MSRLRLIINQKVDEIRLHFNWMEREIWNGAKSNNYSNSLSKIQYPVQKLLAVVQTNWKCLDKY